MTGKLTDFTVLLKTSVRLFFSSANFRMYAVVGLLPILVVVLLEIMLPAGNPEMLSQYLKSFISAVPGGLFIMIFLAVTALIVFGILWSWYDVTLYMLHMAVIRSEPVTVPGLLAKAWGKTSHYFTTMVVKNVIIGIGSLFFLIPGVLMSIWYQFTPIIAAVEDKSTDAFGESKKLMRSAMGKILLRQIMIGLLYFIPQFLLRSTVPGLAVFWVLTLPLFGLLMTSVYSDVRQAVGGTAVSPSASVQPEPLNPVPLP